MATTTTCLGMVVSQPHMAEAVQEARVLEPGSILNDRWDQGRYVLLRATCLGKRYKGDQVNCVKLARDDAEVVFPTTSTIELSVQEIRRRELQAEIQPLTPMPTTGNTQTLDNYTSYPKSEWKPGMAPPTVAITESGPVQVNLTSSPIVTTAQSSLGSLPPPTQPLSNNQPPLKRLILKNTAKPKNEPANTTMELNGTQQTMPGSSLDMSSSPLPDNSFSSSFAIDPQLTAASSPATMQDETTMSLNKSEVQGQADPDLLRRIIDRLGTRPADQSTAEEQAAQAQSTPAREIEDGEDASSGAQALPAVYYPPGVSALSGRGMSFPVKKQKRKRGETPEQSEEEDESIPESSPEVMAPPPKKAQKTKKSSTIRQVSKSMVKRLSPISESLQRSYAGPLAHLPTSRLCEILAKQSQPTFPNIANVVSGNALPHSAAEANAAWETRLRQLQAANSVSQKTAKAKRPDMMPEFFNRDLFPKGADSDTRCVCGDPRDHGDLMVQCDVCKVWQHGDCMGEAVPEDVENEPYSCHVCDPYGHRKLIAGLRKKKVL